MLSQVSCQFHGCKRSKTDETACILIRLSALMCGIPIEPQVKLNRWWAYENELWDQVMHDMRDQSHHFRMMSCLPHKAFPLKLGRLIQVHSQDFLYMDYGLQMELNTRSWILHQQFTAATGQGQKPELRSEAGEAYFCEIINILELIT